MAFAGLDLDKLLPDLVPVLACEGFNGGALRLQSEGGSKTSPIRACK